MGHDEAPRVSGIVLAAGRSSRMGENKLLLEIDGVSLLRRAVTRAIAAGLDPVIVVLGHEAERALRELENLDCRTVLNEDYGGGMGTSLKAGIAAVPESAAAAVSILADMPFVTSEMLSRIVDTYRESDARLVLSDYEGVTAPPILYSRRLFAQIGELPGHCDQRVIKRNRDQAILISWPATALDDIDGATDFDEAKRRLAVAG